MCHDGFMATSKQWRQAAPNVAASMAVSHETLEDLEVRLCTHTHIHSSAAAKVLPHRTNFPVECKQACYHGQYAIRRGRSGMKAEPLEPTQAESCWEQGGAHKKV